MLLALATAIETKENWMNPRNEEWLVVPKYLAKSSSAVRSIFHKYRVRNIKFLCGKSKTISILH